MSYLIAQGNDPQHRWRMRLPEGEKCTLGRTTKEWAIPWDKLISRQHFEILFKEGRLKVKKLSSARNPIYFHGKVVEEFTIEKGERFVIGETSFSLADDQVSSIADAPQPVTEQNFSPRYLAGIRYRNAEQRIEVLSRLPELISQAADDKEMFVRLVNLLLSGVSQASAAGLVSATEQGTSRLPSDQEREKGPIEVLHWDRRSLSDIDFSPSERLIRQAVESQQSVVHIWGEDPSRSHGDFTQTGEVDWAFCTPVRNDACKGWALYLTGVGNLGDQLSPQKIDSDELKDDLKFTELVASTLGSLRKSKFLERQHTSLSQFFSPVVLDAIAEQDPEAILAPKETEVSVLFCDLRGFSLESERSADDLLGLLQRVSRALGVTTSHILEQGGVVGDFHGDAAMGFWGWPLPQEDAAERACRAALEIRAELEAASESEENPLKDFRMGIGIATGRAVAGKIGTVDQVKVTVFGPVVNLAARLESMTKTLRAPILLDEVTAERIRKTTSPTVARIRRVAVVKPYGLENSLEVSQLLPSAEAYPLMSDEHISTYELAVDALLAGDWPKAYQLLHRVPPEDEVKDFLTVFIARHNRTAPPDWNGVVPLPSK